jgi:hypothetical protein
MNNQEYDREPQQYMDASGSDMEREPRDQPDRDEEKEKHQKNEVCDKSHVVSA